MTRINTFIACLVVLLYVAACPVHGAVDMNLTFQTCCDMGLKSAMEQNSCIITEPMSGIVLEEQTLCLSVIELCCARKIREMDCEDGKDAAKTGGNCLERNTTDEQHCCESCKLGLITGSMGVPCNLGETTFGKLWDSAFYSCCTQSDPITPEAQRPEDDNMCEMLQGELCAHICVPTPGSYKCECQPGYTLMADNRGCEIISGCVKHSCSQVCEEEERGFKCSCYEGYQLDSDNITCTRIKPLDATCGPGYRHHPIAKVCQDIDECAEDTPCDSTQECRNNPGGYDCVCKRGLKLDKRTLACVDIDECLGDPCGRYSTCVNTFGSYRCEGLERSSAPPTSRDFTRRSCPTGYKTTNTQQGCEDIDECIDDPCDSTQECNNTPGSYSCGCKPGFQKDDFTGGCVDVNECQLNPNACREGERCDNSPGSYGCVRIASCGTGYTLNQHTKRCEDDDECALGTDTCRFIGAGWECKNVQGSFRCIKNTTRVTKTYTCPDGYALDESKTKCLDINECMTGQHNCRSNELCINTAGNFTCNTAIECQKGFRLREDGRRCNDINECSENRGICSHRCINTWGSFICGCDHGYTLQADNRTCVDANECEGSRRLCMGNCVNKPGSYYCECPSGYRLGADRFSCIDIDECANYPCAENEVCTNIRGSFRCTDMSCQSNYVKDQYKNNKCIRDCRVSDDACTSKPVSYTVHFISLVSNMTLPPNGFRFFKMGSTGSTPLAEFELQPPESDAPPTTEKASPDHFRLEMYGQNSATLIMRKPLEGPQDVHLTIKMSYFDQDKFLGYTIINIELFVSQFTY
uniref:Fibulin-2 n=4 Tax=Lygus hesperus TaxID=30085 RepID=A0A0A9XFE0_LYGHE